MIAYWNSIRQHPIMNVKDGANAMKSLVYINYSNICFEFLPFLCQFTNTFFQTQIDRPNV